MFHALQAPPTKCKTTERHDFCQADFQYYYLYPVSDTFTLLAAVIGLIATDIQDFGGHLLHAVLTFISILLNTAQIFSNFEGNSVARVYEYIAQTFEHQAGGLLYTLVSCIFWYCIVLYQAIYNCKNEHNNQKRRQRINYQCISKQQSFTLKPIDVQPKVSICRIKLKISNFSRKSRRKNDQRRSPRNSHPQRRL